MSQTTSRIVIDSLTHPGTAATGPASFNITIPSEDAVVVCLCSQTGAASNVATVTLDGTIVPTVASSGAAGGTNFQIHYISNPPVGRYTLSYVGAGTTHNAMTLVLLGVDKSDLNPLAFSLGSVTTASLSSIKPGSIVFYYTVGSSVTLVSTEQTSIPNLGSLTAMGIAYQISYSPTPQLTWSGAATTLAFSLAPAQAITTFFPANTPKDASDVISTLGLDRATAVAAGTYGGKSTLYWQNSFLHTIGRILPTGAPTPPTLVAETELETSQIVIDKITQQAITSATSVTSDHNVTSQDAVMLIYASQMGVAQALNSVTLNGVALTALGNPSVSTLTAGAYFVVNPNVGINTVSASATLPTALELITITLLGVDKKTTNPILVANSGASGSPSSTIQVTSANSLLIDFVGSLGTSISEDASQTIYFDQPQTASEAAGSIKLSTVGSQTMSWTTLTAAWVQLVIALEPANALSMWYPAIDSRNLSDVIAVNGLDDNTNSVGNFYATYGTHPAQFWQNSFLHTVGRLPLTKTTPITTKNGSTLLMMGMG